MNRKKVGFFTIFTILIDLFLSVFKRASKPKSNEEADEDYGRKTMPDKVHMIDSIAPQIRSSKQLVNSDEGQCYSLPAGFRIAPVKKVNKTSE